MFGRRRRSSNVPSINPQPPKAVADLVQVLRDPVLDGLAAVPHFAEVGVHPASHRLRLVT